MQQKFYFIVNSSKKGYGFVRSALLTSFEQAKAGLNEFLDNYKTNVSCNVLRTIDATYPMNEVARSVHYDQDSDSNTIYIRSLSLYKGTEKRHEIVRLVGRVKLATN